MRLNDYIHEKPVLTTERLALRALTPADADDLREWTPNQALYQYWGKGPGKADKNPELRFAKLERPSKSFHWGVALGQSGKVIGEIWVYCIEGDRMAKVAFRVSPQYHGQGYATEALREAVRFCFEQTELKRLWSDVDVRNAASRRVMEKCGFRLEGIVRQGKMVSTWCDHCLYGMLKEDFPPLPRPAGPAARVAAEKAGAVRRARPEDIPRIAEILVFGKRAAYREIFQDDAGSFNDLQVLSVANEYQREPSLLKRALAYDDGVVKGVLRWEYPEEGARCGEAELCELYVEPFFLGLGIGHQLMEAFLAEARQARKSRVGLWVIRENAAARRFYASFGFAPTGQERRIAGTRVAEIRCERAEEAP